MINSSIIFKFVMQENCSIINMSHLSHNIIFKGIVLLIISLVSLGANAKDFTVVIDAGHGGKDFGASGFGTFEKNINLAVAKKLGDMIQDKMRGVKVVLTRSEDIYLTLQDRSNIANRAGGDLFISIHTNSLPTKARGRNSIQGAATYTLGLHRSDENLEVAKRENSVIELENDYSETYKGFDPNSSESYIIFEINQSQHLEQSINFASQVQKELSTTAERLDNGVRQAGFWVLAATSMPAVLVELDFICNPAQEKFLNSESGQDKLATALYNAVKTYKASNDNRLAIAEKAKIARELANKRANAAKKYLAKQDIAINTNQSHDKKSKEKKRKKDNSKKKSASKDDKAVVEADNNNPYSRSITTKSVSSSSANLEQRTMVSEDNNGRENKGNITYKIQFLTSNVALDDKAPEFKKLYPVEYYYEDGLYKYTYGETQNMSEAKRLLAVIKSRFDAAFIIKFQNGKRIN